MPHIQQLSSHVADLIAAGEVVERPASVVKELVENAIDAGASAIVVEIQRGGMGLIRVTGIAPDELPTAFLRHATSKLRTEEDLGKIGTLGFRGEALAAISAVSRVDVLTRQSEDAIGAAIHGEGGAMGPVREEGAPAGTTIRVADLFYNTPARLKFMKKDSAETAAVAGLMQHLALSHPDISFKFIKDGQETLHTPGDGKLESAVYAALGREFAKTLPGGALIAFTGGLGAGKTAFCQGLAEGLGCTDPVSSPTFAIVNYYRGPRPLAHFDLYRIHTENDLAAAGFYDYLDMGAVVACEWSENCADLLEQEQPLHLHIDRMDETARKMTLG